MADIIAIGGSFGSANSFGGTYYGVIEQQKLQNYLLVVDNATHGHTVDSVTVTQQHTLAVDNALHSHTVDNVTITQQHTLVVNDTIHSLTSDTPWLIYNTPLVVADALHSHVVDNVIVVQQHTLVVQDTLHSHTVDGVTIVQQHSIVVNDTTHSLTFDGNLAFNQFLLMNKPDDSIHGLTSDNTALSGNQIIVVEDAKHKFILDTPGIVNWAELEVYFGGYIPDYGKFGSLTASQLAELKALYSNLLIENGSLQAVEAELGIHRASYGEIGQLLIAGLLTGVLIPDTHSGGLLVNTSISLGNITLPDTNGGVLISNRPNRRLLLEDGFYLISEDGSYFNIEEDGNENKIKMVSDSGIFKQGFIEYGQL